MSSANNPNNKTYTYEWNKVTVTYGNGDKKYDSIAHLWNKWHEGYHDAKFPRLMIRYEDLLFYTKQTITQICDCVGGEMIYKQPGKIYHYYFIYTWLWTS